MDATADTPAPHQDVTTLTYADGITLRATEQDGEVLVCLADLAHGLGIRNASQLRSRLPEDVCRTYTLQTAGGPQQMLFVTEAGMNLVIWRSSKPAAVAYARWCADRIVELRHHGVTATPATLEQMLADPDTLIQALTALKAERAAREEAMAEAEASRAPTATTASSAPAGTCPSPRLPRHSPAPGRPPAATGFSQ